LNPAHAIQKNLVTQILLQLDLGPGHVSLIIGTQPYEFIAHKYHKPLVAAGFEPLDISLS
jgi:hydrogenase expression/formation protein HypD